MDGGGGLVEWRGALLLLLAGAAAAVLAARRRRRRRDEPPCERGWLPWLGVALAFGRAPLAYIDAARRRHGPVFTLLVCGKRLTFVVDAKLACAALAAPAAD